MSCCELLTWVARLKFLLFTKGHRNLHDSSSRSFREFRSQSWICSKFSSFLRSIHTPCCCSSTFEVQIGSSPLLRFNVERPTDLRFLNRPSGRLASGPGRLVAAGRRKAGVVCSELTRLAPHGLHVESPDDVEIEAFEPAQAGHGGSGVESCEMLPHVKAGEGGELAAF